MVWYHMYNTVAPRKVPDQEDMTKIAAERPRPRFISCPWWWILAGFLMGVCVGQWLGQGTSLLPSPTTTSSNLTNMHDMRKKSSRDSSFVTHLSEIPLQATSHEGVNKQSLVPSFAIHPNLAGLSVASIQPGQTIEKHHHPTMYEFFYVISGEGYVKTTLAQPDNSSSQQPGKSEETFQLRQGSFIQTIPDDFHSFGVGKERTKPLQMIYLGVTTD